MSAFQAVTRDGTPWTPTFIEAINAQLCLGCGRCHKVCGQNVLKMQWVDEEGEPVDEDDGDAEKMIMTVANKGLCIGCSACVRVCGKKAQVLAAAA